MKKVSTFLFVILLFAACKDDNPKPIDEALQAVETAIWGKTLTQVGVPDLPAYVKVDDLTTFLANTGDIHEFTIESKEGLDAPENPAYPGTCAVFEGEGYQVFVTVRPENKFYVKAKQNGTVLMEGTFTE